MFYNRIKNVLKGFQIFKLILMDVFFGEFYHFGIEYLHAEIENWKSSFWDY